jgi:hypothetical protein
MLILVTRPEQEMHWDVIAFLANNFWPPPARRTANNASSRLADWAGWRLFAINLVVLLFVGFALLVQLFWK